MYNLYMPNLQAYKNKWVGLSKDGRRILGSGATLKAAMKKAGKDASYMLVTPSEGYYIPTISFVK